MRRYEEKCEIWNRSVERSECGSERVFGGSETRPACRDPSADAQVAKPRGHVLSLPRDPPDNHPPRELSRRPRETYSSDERDRIRADLIAAAREDERITGAALTGSASQGREDRWSDIDLAFGVREPSEIEPVVADWTARMYAQHGAVHQVDVRREAWLYRVFLLSNSLQVDLAFAPRAEFRARAPSFRLLFGAAAEPSHVQAAPVEELMGYAWLYALHVRSATARGKLWQAEYMVSAMRDHILAAACRRLGLPAAEGRGVDQLPDELTDPLRAALITRLDAGEIVRAFAASMDCLLNEVRRSDAPLAARLEPALRDLLESTQAAVSSSA